MRANEKCSVVTFIEVDIRHRIVPWFMVRDLDLHFQGQIYFVMHLLQKMRRQRMSPEDFHRLARPRRGFALV